MRESGNPEAQQAALKFEAQKIGQEAGMDFLQHNAIPARYEGHRTEYIESSVGGVKLDILGRLNQQGGQSQEANEEKEAEIADKYKVFMDALSANNLIPSQEMPQGTSNLLRRTTYKP